MACVEVQTDCTADCAARRDFFREVSGIDVKIFVGRVRRIRVIVVVIFAGPFALRLEEIDVVGNFEAEEPQAGLLFRGLWIAAGDKVFNACPGCLAVLEGVDGVEGVFNGDQAGVGVASGAGVVQSYEEDRFGSLFVGVMEEDEEGEWVVLVCVSE